MDHVMPRMSPLQIETKGLPWWVGWWIWLKTTRKWILDEDWYFFIASLNISIKIPKGFIFDGASIPKLLRMFFSPVGILLLPGIIHDFGYKYMFTWRVNDITGETSKFLEGYTRRDWDKLFRNVAIQINGFEVLNRAAHLALFIFGGFAWKGHRKNDILERMKSILENDKKELELNEGEYNVKN